MKDLRAHVEKLRVSPAFVHPARQAITAFAIFAPGAVS
jgi:hypothetical protein